MMQNIRPAASTLSTISRLAAAASLTCGALLLAGCGGGDPIPTPTPDPGPLTIGVRTAAAQQTVASNPLCSADKLGSFYWEVGDAQGAKASGAVGTGITASTTMAIASASKWIYGAYVVESRGGWSKLTNDDVAALSFTSGYTNFSICGQKDTVSSCLATGNNDVINEAHVGKFAYDGGHMQHHAGHAMMLGPKDNQNLAIAIGSVLGTEIPLLYTQPQLAGGLAMSPTNYSVFLRKILSGNLAMFNALGTNPVCTNPQTCSSAVRTPIPSTESWDYSMGHWVESDPKVGDGAYSSAGAFGFYPWIDQSKTWYGVLARFNTSGEGGYTSAQCGRLIRKAWVTGKAQIS